MWWWCFTQAVEQKQVLAQGTQGVPPGMAQMSEEEDLQAAEEVSKDLMNLHLSFNQISLVPNH